MKVLIADKFEQSGVDGLQALGCEISYQPDLKDDALTEAIAIADALAAGGRPPGGAGPRPSGTPTPLSPREHHVLSLLAQRYTAPEIADQLYLSVRTVERHVSNVYNKLGVNSRRAAVAAATHYGLV